MTKIEKVILVSMLESVTQKGNHSQDVVLKRNEDEGLVKSELLQVNAEWELPVDLA